MDGWKNSVLRKLGRWLIAGTVAALFCALLFARHASAQTTAERKANIVSFVNSRNDAQTLQVEDALVPLGYVKLSPPNPNPPPVVAYGPRYPRGPKADVVIPPSAVTINVGDNWQTKINAGTTGTVFRIKAGTHRAQVITPKNSQHFIGELGAVVDGNQINNRFIQGSATNVLVKNLVVTNYRNPLQDGMVGNSSMKTLMIEDCDISRSYGFGVRVGTHMKRTYVHHCAQGGLSSYYTTGSLVEDCEFSHDNENGAISGGTTAKIWNTKGFTVRYSLFRDMPRTVGFWADANNSGGEIHNNVFQNIGKSGVYWEISYSARIHDNFFKDCNRLGNDYAGIRLQNSRGVEIYNNVIEGAYAGIQYASSERSNPGEATSGDWVTRDNYSHDNTISKCRYLSQNIDWGDDFDPFAASANNRFQSNKYSAPTNASSPFYWNGNKTWAQWNALGNDTAGSYTP